MTRDARSTFDDGSSISPHEAVTRYTARIESLFEERGGRGRGLMQKAEPFNYALSERCWDDLCWINSEGREVAGYDLKRFQRVAESVIGSVQQLPRLGNAPPPVRPVSSRAPATKPQRAPETRSRPQVASSTGRARSGGWGLLKLLFFAGLLGLVWSQRSDVLAFVQDAVQGFAASRRVAPPPPAGTSLSSLVDVTPPEAATSASTLVKPRKPKAQPLASSVPKAVPVRARIKAENAATASDAAPKQNAETPAPEAALPEPAPAEPPRPARDPNIRMTPKELQSF